MERGKYPAFKVTITERSKDQRLVLHQESYHLVIHEEALRLQHLVSGDVILELPYTHIRKYMVTPNTFSIEAGRMCILGEGVLQMETFEGKSVLDKINKRKEITMERNSKIQNRQHGKDDFYSEPYSLNICNKGIKTNEVAVLSEHEEIPVHVHRTRSSPKDDMQADGVTVVKLTEAFGQNVDTTDTGLYLTPRFKNLSGDYEQLQSDTLADVAQTEGYVNLTPRSDSGIYLSPIHSNRDKPRGREGQLRDSEQRKDQQRRRPDRQIGQHCDESYPPSQGLHTVREVPQTNSDQSSATAPRKQVDRRDPNVQCLSPSAVPPRDDHMRAETRGRPISVSSQTRTSEDTIAMYLTPTLGDCHQQKTQCLSPNTSPIQPSKGQVFSSPTSVQQGRKVPGDEVPSLGRTIRHPTGICIPLSPPKIPHRYFSKLERNDSSTERYVNVNIHPK